MTAATQCSDCGIALAPNPRRKGTRCQRCWTAHLGRSPEKREKCRIAMKTRLADPMERARVAQRCKEGWRRALAEKPELRAQLIETGRRVGRLQKGNNHRPAGSASRRAAAVKQSETRLGWCPLEYRDEYRRLVKNSGLTAAEARALIEQQVEIDRRRFIATGKLQVTPQRENVHV